MSQVQKGNFQPSNAKFPRRKTTVMPTANLTSQGPFAEIACVWEIISAMNDVVRILRCECNEALTLRVAGFSGKYAIGKSTKQKRHWYWMVGSGPVHRLDLLLSFLEVLISPETLHTYNGLRDVGSETIKTNVIL